jgi:hypothetical protein
MSDGATMRVLDVGASSLVLTFSGVVDASYAARLAAEMKRFGGRHIIVDLLDIVSVDDDVQSLLIDAAEHESLTVVAAPWLLHVFELSRRSNALRLDRSLSAAVAASV